MLRMVCCVLFISCMLASSCRSEAGVEVPVLRLQPGRLHAGDRRHRRGSRGDHHGPA